MWFTPPSLHEPAWSVSLWPYQRLMMPAWSVHQQVPLLIAIVLIVIVNIVIIGRVWRVAGRPVAPPVGRGGPLHQDWLNDGTLSAVLALAGIVILVLGVAVRVNNIAALSLVLEAAAIVSGVLTWKTFRGRLGAVLAAAVILVAFLHG